MKENAYKDAGVDTHKAAALVERIKPHVKATNRSGVMSGLGGFGALFDLKETGYQDPILVSATDGVGTKIKIAIDSSKHDTIGIDAVAMCVNDLVVQGAEPLFFLDYFATGKLENDVAEAVIKGVADGCAEAGCALIGGETAEMPGLYAEGDYDLAGFTVGAVERDKMITGESIVPGDVILGLASSGLHSNGFSLVRKLLSETEDATYKAEDLLTPTKIYVKSILAALKEAPIKGMAHITGGGFLENVPRVLPENVTAVIDVNSWDLPGVFSWLTEIGRLTPDDLATTLNCGIGMMVICAEEDADALQKSFEASGEIVHRIGHITERGGEAVEIQNMDQAWTKS